MYRYIDIRTNPEYKYDEVLGDINYNFSLLSGFSGDFLALTGGTISGNLEITGELSATTISGGTIYSGGTDLYDIFSTSSGGTSGSLWSASTGSNSIIANNSSGNLASGIFTIAAGKSNSATTQYSTVSGGRNNKVTGLAGVIGGGVFNIVTGYYSTLVGGASNSSNDSSFVGGGNLNIATNFSSIVGGSQNRASASLSSIVGGAKNHAYGSLSFIGGGYQNTATGAKSFIGGGKLNIASVAYSAVASGKQNTASGTYSFVGGGSGNTISGDRSAIIGGQNIIGSASDTVYVPFFNIKYIYSGVSTINLGLDALGNVVTGTTGSASGTSGNLWSASTGLNSIIANNGTGNLASGSYAVVGGIASIASGYLSFVGGGRNHTASTYYTTIGGGKLNQATAPSATVAGGSANKASHYYSFIGGGNDNRANGDSAVIGGGRNNLASDYSFVGGGKFNSASTLYSSVITGDRNSASNRFSFIGNGSGNTASGIYSFIGTGYKNSATTSYSIIVGGSENLTYGLGSHSFIGGGVGNRIYGTLSTVGGGIRNIVSGYSAFIGGGYQNSAATNYSSVVGGAYNSASARNSFIGGGEYNSVSGLYSSVLGGYFNIVEGTHSVITGGHLNLASANKSFVGTGLQNSAATQYASIVGGKQNLASANQAFIGNGYKNTVSGSRSFVGNGQFNSATAAASFVGGGQFNTASSVYAVVVGGGQNIASGYNTFIGGGYQNSATTVYAVVVGGLLNVAYGTYSFIGNGRANFASGQASAIMGGTGHTVTGRNSAIIGGGSIIGTSDDTVYIPNARLAETTNSKIYSAGTDLYQIFALTGTTGGPSTFIQPGTNITTGGTESLPIVSTVASPFFNVITASGTSLFNSLSATSLSATSIQSDGMTSTGSTRMVEAASGGTLSATKEVVSAVITDSSLIIYLQASSNWSGNPPTASPTGTTTGYQGQFYFGTINTVPYWFFCKQDGLWVRMSLTDIALTQEGGTGANLSGTTASGIIRMNTGSTVFENSGFLINQSVQTTSGVQFATLTASTLATAPLLYVGGVTPIGSELLSVTRNSNAATSLFVSNTTSGTAGRTQVSALITGSLGMTMQTMSAGFTPAGINEANMGVLLSNALAGMNIGTNVATQFSIWTNNLKRLTIESGGTVNTTSLSATTFSAETYNGNVFWRIVPGTPVRVGNTSFTVTDTANINLYDSLLSRTTILKWTETGTTKMAMVSAATYSSNVVTVSLLGDILTSTATMSSFKFTAEKCRPVVFGIAGTISTGTDLTARYQAPCAMKVFGADAYHSQSGVTNATTYDVNKSVAGTGAITTMFTTKISVASTALSGQGYTADNGTTLILGDVISVDCDSVSTSAPVDAYIHLFMSPLFNQYLN